MAQEGGWVLALVATVGIGAFVVLGASWSKEGRSRRRRGGVGPSKPARTDGKTPVVSVGEKPEGEEHPLLSRGLVIPPPDDPRIEAVAPKNELPRRFG